MYERGANLQNIYALPRYPTIDLVLLVEMAAKHLRRLIYRVLNLDSDPSASLGLLYKLSNNNLVKTGSSKTFFSIHTSIGL